MAVRKKITKRIVDALKEGERVWDTDLPGFSIRRQRGDAKSYAVKFRNRPDGAQRLMTIGRHGHLGPDGEAWAPDRARNRAAVILGQAKDPTMPDPFLERKADNESPSMADLCERFMSDHAAEHKKASSAAMDRANIDNHLLPLLGSRLANAVTLSDIDRFKRDVKAGKTAKPAPKGKVKPLWALPAGGPGVANRCLALLSKMFNLAERWGWRPQGSNPCRGVEKYPENRRERFLSEQEMARLGKALDAAERDETETPFVIAAIRTRQLKPRHPDSYLHIRLLGPT